MLLQTPDHRSGHLSWAVTTTPLDCHRFRLVVSFRAVSSAVRVQALLRGRSPRQSGSSFRGSAALEQTHTTPTEGTQARTRHAASIREILPVRSSRSERVCGLPLPRHPTALSERTSWTARSRGSRIIVTPFSSSWRVARPAPAAHRWRPDPAHPTSRHQHPPPRHRARPRRFHLGDRFASKRGSERTGNFAKDWTPSPHLLPLHPPPEQHNRRMHAAAISSGIHCWMYR